MQRMADRQDRYKRHADELQAIIELHVPAGSVKRGMAYIRHYLRTPKQLEPSVLDLLRSRGFRCENCEEWHGGWLYTLEAQA